MRFRFDKKTYSTFEVYDKGYLNDPNLSVILDSIKILCCWETVFQICILLYTMSTEQDSNKLTVY